MKIWKKLFGKIESNPKNSEDKQSMVSTSKSQSQLRNIPEPPNDNVLILAMLHAVEESDITKMEDLVLQEPGLVNANHKYGTPLHYAARDGMSNIIQWLYDHGADVNIRNGRAQETPLHWAATLGRVNEAALLISLGANINVATEGGWTPLHVAAERNHSDLALLLIKHGADINIKSKHYLPLDDPDEMFGFKELWTKVGSTPLDWAIISGNTELAEMLKSHGGQRGLSS